MATDYFNSLLSLPWWMLGLILAWVMLWKGLALWKAARKNHPIWFIILLIVNTFGILEIIYIFLFSDLLDEPRKEKQTRTRRKKRR